MGVASLAVIALHQIIHDIVIQGSRSAGHTIGGDGKRPVSILRDPRACVRYPVSGKE